MEIWETILRSLISIVALFLVTKMIGKKQISQLSIFDYVIGISIGNFAAEMTINLESHETNGIIAMAVFGIVAYAISFISMKSMRIRRFFYGVPTIIIQKGLILYNNMKKVKMDVNDLLEQCRINGYFDISQIDYAILEANGVLSILSKPDYENAKLKDLNKKVTRQGILANIIIDGNVMKENLKMVRKDERWLKQQLKVKGYELDDVLLATIDEEENLVFFKKEMTTSKDVLE